MEDTNQIKSYFINHQLDIKKVVNDYSRYIFTIVANMTKGFLKDEDIEEIISDIFLIIWKNQRKLKKEMPFKPYITVVTKNAVRNKIRSNKNMIKLLELQEDIKSSFNLSDILESQEESEIISKELDSMKDDDNKIFIMFYYHGKKVKEIAKELGYTEFNINTKLHRIRKRIKKVLEERGYNYGK